MKSVQIVSWGATDDLEVRDIPTPEADGGQVRVKVQATGLNPVDWKIIEVMQDKPGGYGAHIVLPSGNGNDYAGVVDQVGEGVTGVSVGDAVFGGSRYFAQAEYVVVDAGSVIPIPDGLTVAQAGGLDIVGRTAVASVRQVAPQAGETVLVSAAAGGVGVIAAQLVRLAGARVIGTASPANHGYLTELGIEPVAYGDGLVERLRELAPEGIDAVLDNQGRATLEAAVELGVPTGRINTIAEHSFAAQHGISSVGGAKADNKDLAELAGRVATGEILFPIDSVYPLDQVTAAYAHLKAGHLRGKVVLEP
ncbi:MAG: NADP-dependent oxidoreductase [Microbacterium ginsengisoli]|uniref:NADP-dependent oxidoreductase n=1 Tax=Microbacterium TaxID=33882 RepID=UPI0006FB0876|nr:MULTISPECIES: NADP-dependent oxidoreductase [unclassified Microbacterium]KQR92201.1 hypothetical protein ASF93_06315 [Microbacterium sp. Leaf347]KQS05933.1 hypothetical protein ASG00_08185 [Microbacterium sp. Leaf351]MBN9197829.1 NADP-dependent oxidoreductase [Microbacterium ginsengisoli]OJU79268.1 MAG: hypothetical protein BGO15_10120 [Microbacterium sp. 71-23]